MTERHLPLELITNQACQNAINLTDIFAFDDNFLFLEQKLSPLCFKVVESCDYYPLLVEDHMELCLSEQTLTKSH